MSKNSRQIKLFFIGLTPDAIWAGKKYIFESNKHNYFKEKREKKLWRDMINNLIYEEPFHLSITKLIRLHLQKLPI